MNTDNWVVPDYYPEFHCKCGDCRHTCCSGWKISVTEKEYYRLIGLDCSERLHERLESSFDLPENVSEGRFRLISPNWLGVCRMLSDDGWCSLQRECGENVLPEICRVYPRSLKTVENLNKASCSASCEEVAEQLMRKDALKLITTALKEANAELKVKMTEIEERLAAESFRLLQDRSLSLEKRLQKVTELLGYEKVKTHENISVEDPNRFILQIFELLGEESYEIGEMTEELESYLIDHRTDLSRELPGWTDNLHRLYPDVDCYFENLICNNIIYSDFPATDSRISDSLSIKGLCLQYFLLVVFTGFVAATRENTASSLADTIQSIYHLVEHTSFYYNASLLVDNPEFLLNLCNF